MLREEAVISHSISQPVSALKPKHGSAGAQRSLVFRYFDVIDVRDFAWLTTSST